MRGTVSDHLKWRLRWGSAVAQTGLQENEARRSVVLSSRTYFGQAPQKQSHRTLNFDS